MGSCDFSSLGNNLSLLQNTADLSTLIANPSGTAFAYRSSLHGQMWQVMYAINDFIASFLPCMPSNKETSSDSLFQAVLLSTKHEWNVGLKEMDEVSTRYCQLLHKDAESNCSALSQCREQLFYIGERLQSAIFEKSKSPAEKLATLEKIFSGTIKRPFSEKEPVEILNRFRQAHAMASIEGLLARTFPLALIEAFFAGQPLTQDQIKDGNEWIALLEANKASISASMLHQALWCATSILWHQAREKPEELPFKVSQIEWVFFRHGCTIFEESDEEHLAWIASLQSEGSQPHQLEIEDTRVTLGKKRVCPSLAAAKIELFENKQDPSKLILFGCNPSQIGLWRLFAGESAWGILPLQSVLHERYGTFCTVENFHCTLDEITWRTEFAPVHPKDLPFLSALIEILKFFGDAHQQEVCDFLPAKGAAPVLLFVSQGAGKYVLKVLPILRKKTFTPDTDYQRGRILLELEAFCARCAKGNWLIFRYLMHTSGLINHSLAHVYRELLEHELMPSWRGSLGVQKEANFRNISDPEIIDRAAKLIEQLKEKKEKLLELLKPQLAETSSEAYLEQLVSKILVEFQRDRGYCSYLCPELTQDETLQALCEDVRRKDPLLFVIKGV